MAARNDSTSRRLAEAFKIIVPNAEWAVEAVEGGRILATFDWEEMDDATIAPFYRDLFTLTSDPVDAPLVRAFAAARLEAKDPTHWLALLRFFAWAHYGSPKRRGARTRWDAVRYSQLLKDFNELKSRRPHLRDEDVFRHLAKRPAYQTTKGRPLSTNRLRKLLKEANDPAQNALLEAFSHSNKRRPHDRYSIPEDVQSPNRESGEK